MSLDRKLAWGALLLGIAGLIPAFKEAGWAWALALIMVLLVVGGYLVYSEWSSTRTAVSVLSLEKKVVIHDRDGRNADLIRTQKIRVNQGWLSDYWFRYMVTDGAFGPFTIDGEPPAESTKLGCLVSYSKRFKQPLAKGDVRELKLETTARDSFLENEEALLHETAQDTRLLILKVEFPAGRVCREAGLLLEAAGEPAKVLEKPAISGDFRTIAAAIKSPKTGYTYKLHWKW